MFTLLTIEFIYLFLLRFAKESYLSLNICKCNDATNKDMLMNSLENLNVHWETGKSWDFFPRFGGNLVQVSKYQIARYFLARFSLLLPTRASGR